MTESTIRYDFKPFKQGADWERTLEFKTAGVANDLTGYKAYMTIRDEPHVGGNQLLGICSTAATANGSVITITGSLGLVTLFMSDTDTDSFNWTKGYYDLKLVGPTPGFRETVPIYGEITVIPHITTG